MSARSAAPPARTGQRGARALPREVRVIGGVWKRTRLPVIDRPGLRPTPDRVRETVFNWLGQTLHGWRCLDAFSGSGALGFEAASRGAAEVVLLDRDAAVVASLSATRERLDAAAVRVVRSDALSWMAREPAASFELVFVDPPFTEAALRGAAVLAAARLLSPEGFVYVESSEPLDQLQRPSHLQPWREDRAGAVSFGLWRMA